ncbi:MAG: hypothetical protein ABI402_11390 [Ferruginibacter sp.]
MMKYLFAITLTLLFCTTSYCQGNVIPELQKICPVNLGDSVKLFTDVIACAQTKYAHLLYSDSSNCVAYSYLPAQKIPFKVGDVGFTHININVGKDKRIISVLYLKMYITTDTVSMEREVRRDYEHLREFFETYFNSQGEKEPTHKMSLSKFKGINWTRTGYRLEIQKQQSKRRDGKKRSSVSIYIAPIHTGKY